MLWSSQLNYALTRSFNMQIRQMNGHFSCWSIINFHWLESKALISWNVSATHRSAIKFVCFKDMAKESVVANFQRKSKKKTGWNYQNQRARKVMNAYLFIKNWIFFYLRSIFCSLRGVESSTLCSFALAGSNSNNTNIAIELFQRMLSAPAPIVKFLRK